MTKTEFLEAVSAFLKKHTTLTLATVDREGWSQAADLFYVSDDALKLYWVSGEKSRHSLNVARVNRVAVTIHNATWDWRDIQGVQLEGEARVITDPDERDRAWMLFRGKFPFTAEFIDQIVRSSFYSFVPRWARLVDNTRSLGHREEFKLP
ncbi:MAG TPA: pyridoxamine 5'-phosphate oxidase family protein [Anaerolineae bacterium]|nr:pyridoxamine 5'-phosphate oxidase family protein [Anaerolineae bacterium]